MLAALGCIALGSGCSDDDDGTKSDPVSRDDGSEDASVSDGGTTADAGGRSADRAGSNASVGAGAGAGAGGSKAEPDEGGAGSEGDAPGKSEGKAGASGSSASAGAGGSSTEGGMTVTGVVVDVSNGDAARNFDHTKYPAIAGVKVCVYEDASIACAMTDSEGKYSLAGLPEGRDVYLTYEKDSFAPTLFKLVSSIGNELPAMLLVSNDYRDSFAKAGGIEPDAASGLIHFGAVLLADRGTMFHHKLGSFEIYYLRGYSLGVAPAAKAGPVYVSSHWQADASLTLSSAAGWGIVQAAPGDYTLTYDHPSLSCPPLTTKVVKGFTTSYANVVCTVDDADADAGI